MVLHLCVSQQREEFLDHLKEYKLLKKNYVIWS